MAVMSKSVDACPTVGKKLDKVFQRPVIDADATVGKSSSVRSTGSEACDESNRGSTSVSFSGS